MLHVHFILRQISRSRKQAAIFVLGAALAIVTLVGVNGFATSIHRALLKDARTLHGADIIIRSNHEFSRALSNALARLAQTGAVAGARIWEFYSVVRTEDDQASLLAHLKVVEPGYPFFGKVKLRSRRDFARVLIGGQIVVAPEVLSRLRLKLGDRLHVGGARLTIADVVLQEPDRPTNFFSLGPRIFIAAADLQRLDLVHKGSRVRYIHLLKVDNPRHLNRLAHELEAAAEPGVERVTTFKTAESRLKRFFDNFLFFLSLIGIFTLLLAGIGIQSALNAFLREKEQTIAIMKTVGATGSFFTRHYVVVLVALGLSGTIIGLLGGYLLQVIMGLLLGDFLPENVKLIITGPEILRSLGLGVVVVAMFSFLPLYRLRDLKPISIFRKELVPPPKGLVYYLIAAALFLFFTGLVFWQVRAIRPGLYFVLGVTLLILVTAVLAEFVLRLLKRLRLPSLVLRQALKGLFRPRNATRSILIALTASLAAIFSIYLLECNLDAAFIKSYPPDAPNLFFLDIQPSQHLEFTQALGMDAEYYPIVQGKILAVKGERIDARRERQRRGDNLGRTFYLTYRNHLLQDEVIVQGQQLFRPDWDERQVSVMDTVAEIKDMGIGDRITFKIQGIALEVRIASIRTRTRESLRPFFYFVFPEDTLREAPQTIFTAVRVATPAIPALQTTITKKFPNISVIDVTATIATFARILKRLSRVIRFFTLFSIVAGVLIILSSISATRWARIREAVYYKILGAKAAFVKKVFALENLFLGATSAVLALLLSQTGSWLICRSVFHIPYRPFVYASLLLVLATVLLVLLVGLITSLAILRGKPDSFLREQTQE
ncbi:MAG: FtsX-like permease family protein [Desulfobacterales bacterium]|nr:MAG: FtsX-like permease family protein [Desulfobacterales bacterium]